MLKLYVYDHCPFCVKARMIFGLRDIAYEPVILLNDDEATPIRMIGKKLLPILEEDGRFMGESMDIVTRIDEMDGAPVLTGPVSPEIGPWLNGSSGPLYRLFLPRAACAPFPEFATTAARAYFVRKKEPSVGPFSDLLGDRSDLIAALNSQLQVLAPLIRSPEAVNGLLSTDDIHLFAQLHSLSLIAGIIYPPAVDAYRQTMSRMSGVPLLDNDAA
ncbi:glutaredoxin 2 [Acetobacter oeni]|uniref:Glutaredoxin 2 n=1 Tax=Acetobacter oeni TaxID=304077 RepID=A0A511XIB6_9PROT|nr:glutaredoxin 2 [Acetobacter oeni]MBB3881415.1 glutaredoxin 2 [Acetobacter oeni]NHO18282.1 glutaredoxin 2 [Acetobacter oeni]GBR11063.1 glutaredoxin 2 [Acetobacter oeni LMG 21952]GEN62692.1 glutaredoxin 2 [Acetobacter oeni]